MQDLLRFGGKHATMTNLVGMDNIRLNVLNDTRERVRPAHRLGPHAPASSTVHIDRSELYSRFRRDRNRAGLPVKDEVLHLVMQRKRARREDVEFDPRTAEHRRDFCQMQAVGHPDKQHAVSPALEAKRSTINMTWE